MLKTSLKNSKGILLLEVIMSVAVIMTALLLITRAYQACRQLDRRAEEMSQAAAELETLLSGFGEGIEEGQNEGDLHDGIFTRWRLDAIHVEETSLNHVTASVYGADGRSSYAVHTYLPDPAREINA